MVVGGRSAGVWGARGVHVVFLQVVLRICLGRGCLGDLVGSSGWLCVGVGGGIWLGRGRSGHLMGLSGWMREGVGGEWIGVWVVG